MALSNAQITAITDAVLAQLPDVRGSRTLTVNGQRVNVEGNVPADVRSAIGAVVTGLAAHIEANTDVNVNATNLATRLAAQLIGGTNVTITRSGNNFTVNATDADVSAANLATRLTGQLVAGNGIRIDKSGNNFTIVNTGSGSSSSSPVTVAQLLGLLEAGDNVTIALNNAGDKVRINASGGGTAYAHPSITGFSFSTVDDASATIQYHVLHPENVRGTTATQTADDELGLEVDTNNDGTYATVALNDEPDDTANTASITASSGNIAPPAGSTYRYRLFAYDTQSTPVKITSNVVPLSTPPAPADNEHAYFDGVSDASTQALVQALDQSSFHSANVQTTPVTFTMNDPAGNSADGNDNASGISLGAGEWLVLFVPANRDSTNISEFDIQDVATSTSTKAGYTRYANVKTIDSQQYNAYVKQNPAPIAVYILDKVVIN